MANSPCTYGGSQRGIGSLPSITSRSAFSSPNRYSSGPATSVIGASDTKPAAAICSSARRSAAISGSNDAFTAMNASRAPTTVAAIDSPSITWYGFARRSGRSLKVPGSPSAPFATTYLSPRSWPPARTEPHFVAAGNPAPPRPRTPARSSCSRTQSPPLARAAARAATAARVRVRVDCLERLWR